MSSKTLSKNSLLVNIANLKKRIELDGDQKREILNSNLKIGSYISGELLNLEDYNFLITGGSSDTGTPKVRFISCKVKKCKIYSKKRRKSIYVDHCFIDSKTRVLDLKSIPIDKDSQTKNLKTEQSNELKE